MGRDLAIDLRGVAKEYYREKLTIPVLEELNLAVHEGEFLALMTGTKLTHVPYKGSASALADVLGGQLSMMFDTLIRRFRN